MRVTLLKILANCLVLLLPIVGALLGYVLSAFLQLGTRGEFRLVNAGAIVFAPTPLITAGHYQLGPAGFVLIDGLLTGVSLVGVVPPVISMLFLTFVNIRISEYIKS